MERNRHFRSGIPIPSQRSHHGNTQGNSTHEEAIYSTPQSHHTRPKTDNGSHYSRYSSSKHNHKSNVHERSTSQEPRKDNLYDKINRPRCGSVDNYSFKRQASPSSRGYSSGSDASSRLKPPSGRSGAAPHTKQGKYCRKQQPQYERLERRVVGCESPPEPNPETFRNDANDNTHKTYNGKLEQVNEIKAEENNLRVFKENSEQEINQIDVTNQVPKQLHDNNLIHSQGRTEIIDTKSELQETDMVTNETNRDVVNYNVLTTSRGTEANSNYGGIRGTISPLSNKILVKRSVGPVDELSFVFGRPDSPNFLHQQHQAKVHHYRYGNGGPNVRFMSPPPSVTSHTSRPMSPSSDVLPARGVGYAVRRVLSPPPALDSSRSHHLRPSNNFCETCNSCLVELKRQALKLMFPDNPQNGHMAQNVRQENIKEELRAPESFSHWYAARGSCGLCDTSLNKLKQEAVDMIQSIQIAQSVHYGQSPAYRYRQRQLMSPYSSSSSVYSPAPAASVPIAAQAQAYLEQNVRAYISPTSDQVQQARYSNNNIVLDNRPATPTGRASNKSVPNYHSPQHIQQQLQQHLLPQTANYSPVPYRELQGYPGYEQGHNILSHRPPASNSSNGSPSSPTSSPSAAASFFARAAQKLGKKKKRHHSTTESENIPSFPTHFSQVIRATPPPAPPCLIRTVGRMQNPGMGKVKVMLKICHPLGETQGSSFLSADPRKKQVTVFDPSASGYVTSANRRTGTSAPKMFAFDSVFTPDDSLPELCAASLAEIVQAVVAGADGCLFTYGYSKLGKTYTMVGSDHGPSGLGVMPCAIAWLFKLINEQKDKTGARFSVRVSAVQVSGKEETLKDLLADIAQGAEATGVGAAPSVYLREDPICGTQLENQSELRAPSADKAALYLDAALAARNSADDDEVRCSHTLFTLNVYQYRIEKTNTKAGLPGVAGGRSRLHLIDLGTASKSKDPNNVSLSLSALGNVITALLNGQRHVPHRDSKISQLLRDSLGNLSCRTCMIAHVSSAVQNYNETLQVIQLAARIHRMKRRRTKFSSTSSEDSSTDGDVKFRRPYRGLRMGTLREDVLYSSSHSDPDYTSSSEQSCDTVIYIGPHGQSLSDKELTDNEGPPRHVPRTNPRLPRRPSGSRSSGDDSDSGRSVRSFDSRLPVRSMISPPPGHVQSTPGSPNPGLVKLNQRIGIHSKVLGAGEMRASSAERSFSNRSEKLSKSYGHHKLGKSAQSLEGEMWIDGPGATIYPEPSANEMWVDGPQAFVVPAQNKQQPSQQHYSDQQHQHYQPQHSQVSASSLSSHDTASHQSRDHHHHHHHHKSDSLRRPGNRIVNAEEQWVDGPREMVSGKSSQPMHTCIKSEQTTKTSIQTKHPSSTAGVSEKALKQALVKHIEETKDKSDSVQAVDEKIRPDSTVSLESSSSIQVEAADSRPISLHSSEEPSKTQEPMQTKQISVTTEAHFSPALSQKKHKLHKLSKHSPSPSPNTNRKCSKMDTTSKLQKCQLPGSASPTNRVAQWIKSVSSEQPTTDSNSSQVLEISDSKLVEEIENFSKVSNQNITMADAETNTEHDSDFERMAEENSTKLEEDGEDLFALGVSHDATTSSQCDEKCNTTLDLSLDSSFDACNLNRDSIYELEVEDCLEQIRNKSGSRVGDDNETFSSLSCSAKDDVEKDVPTETDSLLVQHSKILTESKQTLKLNRHILKETYNQVDSFDNDVIELSQQLLTRKPDGASNPNIHKLFTEESSMIDNSLTSVEAHYCIANLPDVNDCLSSNLDKSNIDENSFCDSDKLVNYFNSKTDGKSPKNKPPLPVTKQSSLPKLQSSNSSPASSSRGGSVTPKSSMSPIPQCKLSKSSVPVVSPSLKIKMGRIDKHSTSSSGVSSTHSPTSSVTSSPNVSSPKTSSPSSSPAQKNGKISSSSKLPSFNSSRNSSPTSKDSIKRKKEKELKETSRLTRFCESTKKTKGHDSDSGNDSGIVAHEKRLLSPYATVTKPRTPSHSSSGHGSDNSTVSTEVHPGHHQLPLVKSDNIHGGTSSGYESMLRDSEGTASSSGEDNSGSEDSKETKKESKRKGTKRSRSAPARSGESSPPSSQPSQTSRTTASTHRTWIENRHTPKSEGKKKDMITKLEGSRTESIDDHDKIVLQDRSGWSFDCKFLFCFSCKSKQRASDV